MKLTHEFDGSVSGPAVVEWGEKVGLVCKMCGVNNLERIINPLKVVWWSV